MLQRIFLLAAVLGAENASAYAGLRPHLQWPDQQALLSQLQFQPLMGQGVQLAQSGDVQDTAERQKRREALRAALKAQGDGVPELLIPKPRSPQGRRPTRP